MRASPSSTRPAKAAVGRTYCLRHRLHCSPVLFEDGFGGAASLPDVPLDPAPEANAVAGADVDLDAQPFAHGLPVQREQAFDQRVPRRPHRAHGGCAHVAREIIDRHLDLLAARQLIHVPRQQLRVEGFGHIEIRPRALLQRQMAQAVVVGIQRHNRRVQCIGQAARQHSLARAGGTGDADQTGFLARLCPQAGSIPDRPGHQASARLDRWGPACARNSPKVPASVVRIDDLNRTR